MLSLAISTGTSKASAMTRIAHAPLEISWCVVSERNFLGNHDFGTWWTDSPTTVTATIKPRIFRAQYQYGSASGDKISERKDIYAARTNADKAGVIIFFGVLGAGVLGVFGLLLWGWIERGFGRP
jgi:hypothetical protein